VKEKTNLIKINQMNISELNRLSIRQYLAWKNIYPVRDRGYYGMYRSPFREDHNASMKVDYNKNLWIDYGTGEGGTMIDLVMRINSCSLNDAITELNQYDNTTAQQLDSFSFHGNINNPTKQEHVINILNVVSLANPALLGYLNERQINIEIAKLHCSEVHYAVNGKPYFAIGYKNDSEGYELRNKYFKGCTSKDITSVTFGHDTCQLFEGFMDYLTFLTIKNWQHSPADVIVLNSLTNLHKIENSLSSYRSVATFLDNDEAGKRAVLELKKNCNNINDQSSFYSGHKDLNEYLCRCPTQKQPVPKKINRGRKL
jgi:DNA primase